MSRTMRRCSRPTPRTLSRRRAGGSSTRSPQSPPTTRSKTGARVVIVDRRGYALVDTSARVRGTENFKSRPEIAQALAGNYPHGVRDSQTLHERLLYVAVPIAANGKVHGAVRITYPFSAVDARIRRYWLLLGADRRRRARGRRGRRSRPRPLRDPAAAQPRGSGGRGRGGAPRRPGVRAGGAAGGPLARGPLQRDRREAVTASSLPGRVRRRRLARAADAVDRAPAAAREPAAEP